MASDRNDSVLLWKKEKEKGFRLEFFLKALYGEHGELICDMTNYMTRNHKKKKYILPGGGNFPDPCSFGYISNSAADIISF